MKGKSVKQCQVEGCNEKGTWPKVETFYRYQKNGKGKQRKLDLCTMRIPLCALHSSVIETDSDGSNWHIDNTQWKS